MSALALLIGAFMMLGALPEASAEGQTLVESELGPIAKRSTKKKKKRTRTRRKKKKTVKKTVKRTGPYLLIGLGGVSVGEDAEGYDSIDIGPGLSLGFGQRITPQFSIEGNVLLSLHDAVERRDSGGLTDPAQNTLAAGTVDLKVWFPIDLPRLEGYGLLSIGYYSFDANRANGNDFSGLGLGFGGGIDWRLTREFSGGFRLQYNQLIVEERVTRNNMVEFIEAQVPVITFMPTAMIRL